MLAERVGFADHGYVEYSDRFPFARGHGGHETPRGPGLGRRGRVGGRGGGCRGGLDGDSGDVEDGASDADSGQSPTRVLRLANYGVLTALP
jgi:hypothetical protein